MSNSIDDSAATAERRAPPYALPAAIGWAVLVAAGGGLGCGWLIGRFGELGTLGLWLLGVGGGWVSQRITRGPSRAAAWSLIAACVLAALVALVAWLHWLTVQGEEGWLKAASLLPALVREYKMLALATTAMTACGAHSAWWLARGR